MKRHVCFTSRLVLLYTNFLWELHLIRLRLLITHNKFHKFLLLSRIAVYNVGRMCARRDIYVNNVR